MACSLLMGVWSLQSCKDDDLILTGQPSWLGNSIYEWLQEKGNYTVTTRLIDDMGLTEVFSHTGSRTLFAANDSAYNEWFKSNSWGARKYEDLTMAQKRLLLNNSMISNAYLIELMSNAKAVGDAATPEEGRTMRRETSSSVFDSVYVLKASEMPNVPSWEKARQRGKDMPLFKDLTTAPMIHFLPDYMQYNKITDSDLKILTNHQADNISDAWIDGQKVIERDITCKNGYVQRVKGVIESSPNMAEIIRSHQNMSKWSHLLDRFSAPYYDAEATREYNRIYNNEDSCYVLRYFSRRSAGGNQLAVDPDGNPVGALLTFDPGWNQYIDANSQIDLHYDAGAMIVPSNEALETWWNNEGRDLQDEYKVWDSIPDNTIAKLLNVNMLSTFSEAVPSKFAGVLNDAKEELGIKAEDVDSCFMGCNGVVYLSKKVFMPAEFSSVSYPALAHASTMNTIYWAISGADGASQSNSPVMMNFLPYLLAMDSKYALILPTNNAMMTFIDPASYSGSSVLTDQEGNDSIVEMGDWIQFYYDIKRGLADRVQAIRLQKCEVSPDGEISNSAGSREQTVARNVINSMLNNLVNEFIIVIPDKSKTIADYVDAGYTYFKSRGGALLRFTRLADGTLAVQGGWQIEHGDRKIPVDQVFNKTNGQSFQIDQELPMTAENSLYLTLHQHPEYSSFLTLLENDYCDLLSTKLNNKYNSGLASKNSKNLRLFDNYNYTVYVPTNASIEKLIADGILPSEIELDRGDFDEKMGDDPVVDSICIAEKWYPVDATETDKMNIRTVVVNTIREVVNNFIRYHVHDRSIAVGMAVDPTEDPLYESMLRNISTGRFYPLRSVSDQTSLTITDNVGNVRHVVTKDGHLYNQLIREYWYEGAGLNQRLFMGSDAVVHLIDGPLFYETLKPWRQLVKEALEK